MVYVSTGSFFLTAISMWDSAFEIDRERVFVSKFINPIMFDLIIDPSIELTSVFIHSDRIILESIQMSYCPTELLKKVFNLFLNHWLKSKEKGISFGHKKERKWKVFRLLRFLWQRITNNSRIWNLDKKRCSWQ